MHVYTRSTRAYTRLHAPTRDYALRGKGIVESIETL